MGNTTTFSLPGRHTLRHGRPRLNSLGFDLSWDDSDLWRIRRSLWEEETRDRGRLSREPHNRHLRTRHRHQTPLRSSRLERAKRGHVRSRMGSTPSRKSKKCEANKRVQPLFLYLNN